MGDFGVHKADDRYSAPATARRLAKIINSVRFIRSNQPIVPQRGVNPTGLKILRVGTITKKPTRERGDGYLLWVLHSSYRFCVTKFHRQRCDRSGLKFTDTLCAGPELLICNDELFLPFFSCGYPHLMILTKNHTSRTVVRREVLLETVNILSSFEFKVRTKEFPSLPPIFC